MGKSEEQKLIDFLNWYNPDGAYNEIIVHEYLKASHSPTEPEFDTLQEGDWFQGTREQYEKVLNIQCSGRCDCYDWCGLVLEAGFLNFRTIADMKTLGWDSEYCKTQLTPEESLRRADNTFKTR